MYVFRLVRLQQGPDGLENVEKQRTRGDERASEVVTGYGSQCDDASMVVADVIRGGVRLVV